MNDLRHDINEVFAKQQGQLGDAAGTGNRMLRAATAGRRVNRQFWPSVAGVALVLVAAAAIGVSVVVRGLHPRNVVTNHPSPTPIATPTATPAPTPMSQQLQVPATTPVILFHDPVDFQQVDGITWDGSARGRIAADPDFARGFTPNPSGTLFGGTGYIRDRAGRMVASPAVTTKGFAGTWSDDGQHYCSMVSKSQLPPAGGEPATLQVTAVGQAPRTVVQVGRMYDQSSTGVAACSIEKDRAIVVHSGSVGNTMEFWVVQLSTGRIMWTRSYSADGASVDVRTSRDGQYIAENKSNCCPATKTTTTIYGPTGAVLGHPAGFVEEFSWDGSLAVMGTFNAPVSVVRWRDGTVVWNGPSGDGFLGAMPEPGGQSIAISVSNPGHPQTGGFYPGDIYIVGPDGRATELIKNVVL
jgi:hypothetical protein